MFGFLMIWLISSAIGYIAIPGEIVGMARLKQAAFYGFIFAIIAALLSQCGFGGGDTDFNYRR